MINTVVTLICNPADAILDNELAERVSCFLDHVDIGAPQRVILAKNTANDFLCPGEIDPRELESEIKAFLGDLAVDVVVQKAGDNRRKRLLIADMDSTIIQQECIDELAEFAGKRAEISAITERAMRGELDFEEALKERVSMLKGVPESALAETFEHRLALTPGARILVQTMNKIGSVTALVSGGFTFFTDRVAAATGFHTTQANDLCISDGALTGAVSEPILGRAAKRDALHRIASDKAIALDQTLAVGDGANDLSMLESAGLGVAYHAKPAVAEAAHARIDHGDLTALLYLQGVKMSEFALT